MEEVSKKRKAVDVNEKKNKKPKIRVEIPSNKNANTEEDEEFINFNMFDFNIISKIFTFITIPCNINNTKASIFKDNFTYCNNFRLVSKLFNEISNQKKFKYNLAQNTFYINYKIYLKLLFIKKILPGIIFTIYKMLKYASYRGYYDLIDFVLKNTKNVSQQTLNYSLLESCKSGHLKTSKILISYGSNVNFSTDALSETPLFNAVKSRNIKLVKYLIKQNADIECQDTRNSTPIFTATNSRYQNLDIVKLLVSKNCNLNHQNAIRNTALYEAIRWSSFEIIEFLISHQPMLNLYIENGYHETALDIAIKRKNKKIIDLIKKYSEKQTISK